MEYVDRKEDSDQAMYPNKPKEKQRKLIEATDLIGSGLNE
jgi:hypothetical protein